MKRSLLLAVIVGFAAVASAATASELPTLLNPLGPSGLAPAPPARAAEANSGSSCGNWRVLDFEGVGNLAEVGEFYGDVHFSPEWFGLVDSDAGGTGNFANEPSPDTVAFAPDDDTTTPEIYIGVVDLDEAVAGVGFHYASISDLVLAEPLTLTVYDAGGSLLGTYPVSDTPIYTGGDPEGAFSEFYSVEVVLTSDIITRVELAGAGSYWAIDNFRLTTLE